MTSNIWNNVFKGIFIIILIILCMLVLHFKYYKHHLVAIMIIFFGLIIDSIVNTKYKEDMNVYLYIVLMFLCSLFEALQDVLEKYLMEKM